MINQFSKFKTSILFFLLSFLTQKSPSLKHTLHGYLTFGKNHVSFVPNNLKWNYLSISQIVSHVPKNVNACSVKEGFNG